MGIKKTLVGLAAICAINYGALKAQENTITHKYLEIRNEDYIEKDSLDSIIKKASGKINPYSGKTEILNTIEETVTEYEKRNKVNFDCDEESLIYKAIGEANNLPIECVVTNGTEGHMYIKWGDVNWETTTGKQSKKEDYINPFISENSINKSYLKELTPKEIESIAHWQNAGELIKEKNYEKALESCDSSVALNPFSVEALQVKGACLEGLGKLEEAIESYEKAIELNPSPTLYKLKGQALDKLNETEEAIESYTQALNLIGKYKEYLLTNEITKETFSEMRKITKMEKENLLLRGTDYFKEGEKEKSKNDFDKRSKI